MHLEENLYILYVYKTKHEQIVRKNITCAIFQYNKKHYIPLYIGKYMGKERNQQRTWPFLNVTYSYRTYIGIDTL